jgi:hypothetical protein
MVLSPREYVSNRVSEKKLNERGIKMRKICILALSFLMIIGFSSMAGAAPTLSFQIDFGQDGTFETGTIYKIDPGTSVWADLYFTVTEEGVIGGGLSMQYDSTQSAVLSYAYDPAFTDAFSNSYNVPGDLGLNFFHVPQVTATDPGQHKLAEFHFECLGMGEIYPLMIYDFGATDDWVTASGLVLDDQLAGGVFLAEVNQVPIPGAVWLLGSGLLGLVGLVRRQR